MNNQEVFYNEIERLRNAFMTPVEEEARKAIQKQYKAFFDKAELEATELPQLEIISKKIELPTEPIKTLFEDIYTKVGVFFIKQIYRMYVKFNKNQLQTKDFADDFQSVWLDYMRSFARLEAGDRITYITGTTKDNMLTAVRIAISEGLENGTGVFPALKRMQEILDIKDQYRFERIARTEIISASNAGSLKAAQSTNLNLKKVWLSTRDIRTRDSHLSVNGQSVLLSENFVVGGEQMRFPGDPKARADNTINCRCSLYYESND